METTIEVDLPSRQTLTPVAETTNMDSVDHSHFFPTHALTLLLIALGSDVPARTVAESHTCATADRQGTAMVTRSLAPTGSVAHKQLTVDPATVHVPRGDGMIVGAEGPTKMLELAANEIF